MNYRPMFILFLWMLMISSCVLEERYHFHDDLSGTYEMSFSIKSLGQEEEDTRALNEQFQLVDSLVSTIGSMEGVTINQADFSDKGFDVSMDFDDVQSLGKLESVTRDNKAVKGLFDYKDKRFTFQSDMSVDQIGTNSDQELSQWFTQRIVITFDSKIKRTKYKGFKKLDKYTLIYDSEKMPDVKEIMFNMKMKQ